MSHADDAKPGSPAEGEAPSGLPVLPPLAAVIEIVILIIAPGMLDLMVPGFPSLNETQPHFYWLPVLLLTLQYGSASGLLAAGTAIFLASVLGWPEQEIGENHFSYLLRIWLQPVLWIAAAVILGQLRLRQIERKQALGRAVAELTEQRRAIAEHARDLRERCDRLERVIASRHAGDARELLAALGRIQSADGDTATRALGEALALAFGDARVSILTLEGGHLKAAYRHAPSNAPQPPAIAPSGRMHRALVDERRALCVMRPGDEHDLGSAALAAVPITGPDGASTGAIVLESGDGIDVDEGTIARLTAVATSIGGRLEPSPGSTTASRPLQLPAAEPRRSIGRQWRRARRDGGSPAGPVRAGRTVQS